MPKKKLLVDSCSYFRLAQSIHPLLGEDFGIKQTYVLYLIEEFEREYMKSSRLKGKFGWVRLEEYLNNRRRYRIRTSPQQKDEIAEIFEHMSGFAIDEGLTVSPEDIRGVATAYVCQIPIVSDDGDLVRLALEFDVKSFNSLALLSLMKKERHIDIELVKQIVSYWAEIRDIPANCQLDCDRLFKIDYVKLINSSK